MSCLFTLRLAKGFVLSCGRVNAVRSFGVFRLTSPEGLEAIQVCERTGFHPHNEPFMVYDHCRHVTVAPTPVGFARKAGVKVEDLRFRRLLS